MKSLLLRFAQRLISTVKIPGRYLLANTITKVLLPTNYVAQGSIGSYRLKLNLTDPIQQQIYFGIYSPIETKLVRKLLKPGDIFFDIGANVGYFSLLASQIIKESGKVFAFEPLPGNVDLLNQTILKNKIDNITVNQTAVGASSGSLDLYVGEKSYSNSSAIQAASRPNLVSVEMIALDDFWNGSTANIRLIKLDIEGWELYALQGMENILSEPFAPDILIEVNPYFLARQDLDSRDLTKFLAKYGYSIYDIRSSDINLFSMDAILPSLTNLYCTKSDIA